MSLYEDDEPAFWLRLLKIAVATIIILICLGMWGCPQYRVYEQTMDGEAELRKAEFTKKVIIEDARAKEEAANMVAQARITQAEAEGKADIVRATATAKANEIMGDSLKGKEEYLRYLWIQGLKDASGERIYIPTEAGLPILEARLR